ncbi:MAG: lysophospholipid acyltransferase family protein [Elusimicrobia bacterium]|nr:lysophospholipid acyltransferase family protein [Elusimicrobiota bacterium]
MLWLAARILWLYTWFVVATSRTKWIGKEHGEIFRKSESPAIYTFWHNRQALLLYYHRGQRINVFISPSRDGELIARIAACFGIPVVRGSSRKKPIEGLLGLFRQIKKGDRIAITPDGPIGPARQVKQGVVYLARALGIHILPLTCSFARKVVLNSWDKFLFPLPFNRIVVGYDKPFLVGKHDDLGKKAEELKVVLDNLTAQADALADSL